MNTPKSKQCIIPALAFISLSGLLSSCSNARLENRLEKRNDNYSNLQDRREMRQDARQDRTDAWFDRVMH